MVEDLVRALGFLCLGTRMKRIGDRLQAETQVINAEHGMDIYPSQYPYLAAIDRLGPLTVGDIAQALGVTQPGATRTINQLVKDGYMMSDTAADDQRRRIVRLTDRGQQVVDIAKTEIWPRIEAAVADLCGGMNGPLLQQLTAIEDGLADLPLNKRRPKA